MVLEAPAPRYAPPNLGQLARHSLGAFVAEAWHIFEPGRQLVWNWHLDGLCKHLEAMLRGEILNMLYIVPPGTSKSRIIAGCFPAFGWIDQPQLRWLFLSNSDENANRDSMVCRRIIESDWYQRTFRPRWGLQPDQNQKGWYETTAGGHRNCAGIGGTVTGKKGDFIVIDDANDAKKVQGEADRNKVNATFDDAIWDRVNDFNTGRRLIVGQRTHTNDLIGHVKNKYRWPEFYVPEEFRPAKRCVTYVNGVEFWRDPRDEYGELLRPDQMTRAAVDDYKMRAKTLFNTKHNGEPVDRAGTRFKLANFRHWRKEGPYYVLPCPTRGEYRFHERDVKHRFGVADGASSAKTSADFTVISSFLVSPRNDLVWIGCKRFQAEIPDQPKLLKAEYAKHKLSWIGIEAVASNNALFQFSSRDAINVVKFDPKSKDKLSRATPAIMFTEAHRMYLPDNDESEGFPIDDVQNELTAFTGDEKVDDHDDIVDTLAYAVWWLTAYYPEQLPRPSMQTGVGGVIGYDRPDHPLHPQPKPKAADPLKPPDKTGGVYFPPYMPE
jgi:phage terminase large subunit-like protein